MPDSFDLNNVPRATDAVPQIPTSSSEVAVRTMASDFELMGQSGGMVNQTAPQGMQVPVTLHPEVPAPGIPVPQPSGPGLGKIVLITVIIIVAMGGLFALGYFVIGK
jgi:hypothetical protein